MMAQVYLPSRHPHYRNRNILFPSTHAPSPLPRALSTKISSDPSPLKAARSETWSPPKSTQSHSNQPAHSGSVASILNGAPSPSRPDPDQNLSNQGRGRGLVNDNARTGVFRAVTLRRIRAGLTTDSTPSKRIPRGETKRRKYLRAGKDDGEGWN